MKLSYRLVAGLAWLAIGTTSMAADYTIDAGHSGVMFKVRHLAISSVTGRFEKFSGSFSYDPKNVKASKAEALIEAASINTDQSKRDDHLRNADFFDVEKFPELKFVSKSVKNAKKDRFDIVGDLTLHGVTKSVVLNAEFGGATKDPWGNNRIGFTASTTINRKDFGLTYHKALETGGLVVGEEVKITLEIEGIQKKEEK